MILRRAIWMMGMMAWMAVPLPGRAVTLTDCPGGYQNKECNDPGYTVCDADPWNDEWTCLGATASDDTIFVVTDDDKNWAWGDIDGTPFCCYGNEGEIYPAIVSTFSGADHVYLKTNAIINYSIVEFQHEERSTIDAGSGADYVLGSDYASGSGVDDDIDVGPGEDEAYGGGGSDYIHAPQNDTDTNYFEGGDNNDTLLGGGGIDTLLGEGGNDHLYGYHGNDSLNGGSGSDWLNGQGDSDTVVGGSGDYDTVCGGHETDYLDSGGESNDVCYDEDDIETGYGCPSGYPTGSEGYCPSP